MEHTVPIFKAQATYFLLGPPFDSKDVGKTFLLKILVRFPNYTALQPTPVQSLLYMYFHCYLTIFIHEQLVSVILTTEQTRENKRNQRKLG
jgi:hypothetical protein